MVAFSLKIITPDGVKFDQEVNSIETTTTNGRIGIYANHVNLTAQLKPNILTLKLKTNQKEEYIILSGYLFFENNQAKIITDDFFDLKNTTINSVNESINTFHKEMSNFNKESLEYQIREQKINKYQNLLSLLSKKH